MSIHIAAAVAALRISPFVRSEEAYVAAKALRRWLGTKDEPKGFCGHASRIPKFRRGGLPSAVVGHLADDVIRHAWMAVHFLLIAVGEHHARKALEGAALCMRLAALRSAGKGPARPRMRVADEAEAIERKMQAEDFKTLGIQE